MGRISSLVSAQTSGGQWILRRGMSRLLRRHGWMGILLPLVLAWVFAALGMQHWQVRQVALKQSLVDDRPPVSRSVPASGDDVAARIANFEVALPSRLDLPQRVNDLSAVADSLGLVLAKADYRAQVDLAGGLVRYRMAMPLRGPSAKVLSFVQRALDADQALALEGIQIKRDSPASDIVDADLRWVLFARADPQELRR